MSAAVETWPPAIRAMAEEDLPKVVDIERRAYAWPWSRGIFVDCLRVPYRCEVLEEAGVLVGYSVMAVAVDEAHLLNLCIEPAAQGRGLGGFMLDHAMRCATQDGSRVIYLEVRPSNAAALSLYGRAGFVRIGVRRNYYHSDVGREDALVLARALGD